jgi:RimJ/RimL family protein N-acetyltransferase
MRVRGNGADHATDRPILLIGGLRIRPYTLADAQTVVDAVRESIGELQPWMPWCHPRYGLDESKAWLDLQVPAFQRRTAFEFAVVSTDGTYLGGCGVNQLDALNRRANLGYWVRTRATRRGVATAAVALVRDWIFQHTDLIRLEVIVAVDNAASQRVAEKSGAVREGTLRSRLILNGSIHDATMFSMIRP